MRALLCIALLALAGCADDPVGSDAGEPGAVPPTGADPAPMPANATAPVSIDVNGTVWIPPPSGNQRSEQAVPFVLNATADVHVALRLGSTLTPVSTADVVAELRDAAGKAVAQATFTPPGLPPDEESLDCAACPAGAYELHFAMWGGSDGSSGGDHIDYRIQAS